MNTVVLQVVQYSYDYAIYLLMQWLIELYSTFCNCEVQFNILVLYGNTVL